MANDCYFVMQAVSRNKAALTRLLKIMRYKDPSGIYLYRVREVHKKKSRKVGEFWTAEFSGDVAWGDYYWFYDYYWEHNQLMLNAGIPESKLHSDPEDEANRRNFRTFRQLCPDLGIGVEVWTEELGCEFQGHRGCTVEGCLTADEIRPYAKNDDGTPESGYEGFGEQWGDWEDPEIIYYGERRNK